MTPPLTPGREKALRTGLRDLPELGALAATTLPGERLGGEGGGRSVPGSRPPLNLAALDLTRRTPPCDDPVSESRRAATEIAWVGADGRARPDAGLSAGILTTLESWTRMAEAEMLDAGQIEPDTLAATPTVDSECAWLLRRIVWLLEQPWVGELADDVARLVAGCRAVLRERPTYRPRCPRCPTGVLADAGNGYWSCTECGQTHRDSRMGLREIVARQEPMTAAQLSAAFAIPAGTVKAWQGRGQLTPALDDDGQPLRRGRDLLFHLTDALRLRDRRGPRDTDTDACEDVQSGV